MMRVVHICTSLNGGAGLCASRIIQATKVLGIDARAVVKEGQEDKMVSVVRQTNPWSGNWLFRKIQVLLCKTVQWPKYLFIELIIAKERQKHHQTICFTSPITSYTKLPEHPWIKDADIVHLHWIGGFVDYPSFFRQIDKPVVWTIHDENPGLGGFHYISWKEFAPKSFQLLDDKLVQIKEIAYKNATSTTLVAISSMMADFFRENQLLRQFPLVVIHNGVDGNAFVPIDSSFARGVLGIRQDDLVFLFVAQDIHEERKGFAQLMKALEGLKIPNINLLCIGHFREKATSSFRIRYEGFIPNNYLLSLYYSAADFLVMPSFQEAFAQTPLEAMACGTPVISYPCSGASDLINKQNGIVCRDFTVEALMEGIQEAIIHNYSKEHIRKDVLTRFSYDIIAKQYYELYKKILQE